MDINRFFHPEREDTRKLFQDLKSFAKEEIIRRTKSDFICNDETIVNPAPNKEDTVDSKISASNNVSLQRKKEMLFIRVPNDVKSKKEPPNQEKKSSPRNDDESIFFIKPKTKIPWYDSTTEFNVELLEEDSPRSNLPQTSGWKRKINEKESPVGEPIADKKEKIYQEESPAGVPIVDKEKINKEESPAGAPIVDKEKINNEESPACAPITDKKKINKEDSPAGAPIADTEKIHKEESPAGVPMNKEDMNHELPSTSNLIRQEKTNFSLITGPMSFNTAFGETSFPPIQRPISFNAEFFLKDMNTIMYKEEIPTVQMGSSCYSANIISSPSEELRNLEGIGLSQLDIENNLLENKLEKEFSSIYKVAGSMQSENEFSSLSDKASSLLQQQPENEFSFIDERTDIVENRLKIGRSSFNEDMQNWLTGLFGNSVDVLETSLKSEDVCSSMPSVSDTSEVNSVLETSLKSENVCSSMPSVSDTSEVNSVLETSLKSENVCSSMSSNLCNAKKNQQANSKSKKKNKEKTNKPKERPTKKIKKKSMQTEIVDIPTQVIESVKNNLGPYGKLFSRISKLTPADIEILDKHVRNKETTESFNETLVKYELLKSVHNVEPLDQMDINEDVQIV